jgi:hypothetical protein
MSEEERRKTWQTIASLAKKIILFDSDNDRYQYVSEIDTIPDCKGFHNFIFSLNRETPLILKDSPLMKGALTI